MDKLYKAPVAEVWNGDYYAAVTVTEPKLAECAMAGQFLHMRCEGFQLRRPISIGAIEGNQITVFFEKKGKGTQWLASRKVGDELDILGPLGHGFPMVEGPILLVGGGVGVPPMHFCAQCYMDVDAVVAYRNRERALLDLSMKQLCGTVKVMTDDGSLGDKGFAAQGVKEMLEKRNYAAVFACGPKIMLKTTYEAAKAAGVPCWVSLEERMGCGVGACLTCATPILNEDGSRGMKEVCKDGPVFRGEEVIWDA